MAGVYGFRPHEVRGASINGERVGYVNIPGKGYIAISPTGKAYTYNDRRSTFFDLDRSSFKPINLSNYDRLHIFKATLRNGGVTGLTGRDALRVADYWVKLRVPKSISSPVNQSSGVSKLSGNNSQVGNTLGKTSFRDAFNQARNSGLSEFTWGGKRFNTRNKGEENYTWDAGSKRWVDPLVSVKQLATFTTDNIAPISVPRERVETPSLDYAANISSPLTNPNSSRYTLPRTATPTFVGQTNNNWLRDMFRDTFRTFNFG